MPSRKTSFPQLLARKTGPERRTQTRHSCGGLVPYRIGDHFGTARLCDVSTGGVALLLPRRVERGGLLTVELRDRGRNSLRLKMLRVVHATPKKGGLWLVGSAFTRTLTDDELAAILPLENGP